MHSNDCIVLEFCQNAGLDINSKPWAAFSRHENTWTQTIGEQKRNEHQRFENINMLIFERFFW